MALFLKLGEGLLRMHLIVQDHRELAERRLATLAVDDGAFQAISAARPLRFVAHDDGVQVGVYRLVALEQGQQGLAVAAHLVVERSVRVLLRIDTLRRALQFGMGQLRAIPLRAGRLDVDRGKEAEADLAAVAFAAHRCAHRMGEVGAFAARDPADHRHPAGGDQRAGGVAGPDGLRCQVVEDRTRYCLGSK